jgi:hypothetical protein
MSFGALVPVLIAAAVLFALAIAAMALGAMFGRRCLQGGTCGGRRVIGSDGEPLSCSNCPNRTPTTE